ncbi:epimerase [Sphingobacterium sp. LRF_L2]|uniref:epimerase n=1 Tax=Sphingobacterium sp. LRF_L2 TaxID=3369421 RepID=UPI003F61F747
MHAKVVLAGGTGQLGRLLATAFLSNGYEVFVLTRNRRLVGKSAEVIFVYWDGKTLGDWIFILEGTDTLINLSGKSIQCSFTDRNKEILKTSRILPTRILGEAIGKLKVPPRLWINFSGVSLFGGLQGVHDEHSIELGIDFLAVLTQQWEDSFFGCNTKKTKKVALRISPVLSRDKGFFAQLYPLVRYGLGGQLGNGRQMVSWIHELDLSRLVLWIIQQQNPSCLYHACSPFPVLNKEFMDTFRKCMGVPIAISLPDWGLKLGASVKRVDPGLLLQTIPVTTSLTLKEGFQFSYPHIREAINQLLVEKEPI